MDIVQRTGRLIKPRLMMIIRVITIIVFTLGWINVHGQDNKADSLLRALKNDITDSGRATTLFELAEHYIFKPGEERAHLDSADRFLQQASRSLAHLPSEDLQGFHVLLKSFVAKERRKTQEGRKLASQAVEILQRGSNKFYLGKAYFGLSEYYDYGRDDEFKEKVRLVRLACDAFIQTPDKVRYALTLTFLADLYQTNSQFVEALKLLEEALPIYLAAHYSRLSAVYILYSSIYHGIGNDKQSLAYSLMALKDAEDAHDSSMTACQINNRIGITLDDFKEYEKAIGYFKKALQIAIRHGDNNSVSAVTGNIVNTYLKQHKPAEALAFIKTVPPDLLEPNSADSYMAVPFMYLTIYSAMKNYAAAESYARTILNIIREHPPMDESMAGFYQQLVSNYLATGQYASAALYAARLDSVIRQIGSPHKESTAQYLLFRVDTALGNYKSAIGHLLIHQQLNDSLFSEANSKLIRQLEMEYETKKTKDELKIKNQNIQMLNQKNQLQQNTIDRANLVRNFTIGGILLAALVIGLLYRQYKLKQKSNATISRQNEQLQHLVKEKEWLVTEIHHRVKNNFHVIASLLDMQSSYLKNSEALTAIRESQHRIHAMSIIHQRLYQADELSTIYMPEYIYELVDYLRDSFGVSEKINFVLQIERIRLNHALAITLGLILNEAITNSIKYAFTNGQTGKVSIQLEYTSPTALLLTISDNGKGLPAGFADYIGGSIGMDLLKGLTEDIGGIFNITTNEGTQIDITFEAPNPS